jgi:hypothetical protein
MADASPTLREMFGLEPPQPDASNLQEAGSADWDGFKAKLHEELKGIRWTAAMPDLLPMVAELFDVPISDFFIAWWKKADAIAEKLKESGQTPEEFDYLSLSEHTITGAFHPRIDVKIPGKNIPAVEFTTRLSLKLESFRLRIQNGRITHITAGRFGGKGTILYKDLSLVEKQFDWHELPLAIAIDEPTAGNDR